MSYTECGVIPDNVINKLLLITAKGESKTSGEPFGEVWYRTKQNVDVSGVQCLRELWPLSDWHGAMLVSIPPGGHIPLHTESCGVSEGERGPWRKFHIPLQTNRKVISYIDGEGYHLDVGKVYEIDFKKAHESFNKGPTDRIHLVMEIYE